MRRALHRSPEESSDRLFVILSALWESLGVPFSEKTVCLFMFFCLSNLDPIWGGAGGRGFVPLGLQNMQSVVLI